MKIRTAWKNWRHNKTRWQKQRVFACQGGQTSFPAAEAEHALMRFSLIVNRAGKGSEKNYMQERPVLFQKEICFPASDMSGQECINLMKAISIPGKFWHFCLEW